MIYWKSVEKCPYCAGETRPVSLEQEIVNAVLHRGGEVTTVLGAIAQASPQGVQTTTNFLEADGTETPIEVRYIEEFEENPVGLDELRQLPILTPAGEFTAMEEVARVRTDEGLVDVEMVVQPRPREIPVRFGRLLGDPQHTGRLSRRQPTEESQLDDLRLPLVELREGLQRLVERQDVDVQVILDRRIGRQHQAVAAALEPAPRPGVVDQDLSHG